MVFLLTANVANKKYRNSRSFACFLGRFSAHAQWSIDTSSLSCLVLSRPHFTSVGTYHLHSIQLTTESRRGRRKLGRTRVRHACLSFNERFGNNDSSFLQRASLPRREAVAATWTERNYLHRSFLLWQEPECSLRERSLIHRGKTNKADGCSLTGEEMYLEKLQHSWALFGESSDGFECLVSFFYLNENRSALTQ